MPRVTHIGLWLHICTVVDCHKTLRHKEQDGNLAKACLRPGGWRNLHDTQALSAQWQVGSGWTFEDPARVYIIFDAE